MQRRQMLAGGMALAGLGSVGAQARSIIHTYVPPEEGLHQRTFMQWPVSRQVHPDAVFLDMLQDTIANIANAISEFEPVTMLAAAEDHPKARRKLAERVTLMDVPTEDLWCRDSGPVFTFRNGALAISNIQFNGWGGKQVHSRDAQIAAKVAQHLSLRMVETGLTGEAGGVEHDGDGLLIAHESSWVNDNRNPGMTKHEVARRLRKAYGAQRVIWSKGVYGADITDYHIDSLARFTRAGRVLMNLPEDPDMGDPFHVAALDTHDALQAAGLEIEVIPEPRTRRVRARDFVASYANYYACNGGVIAAQFGDPETDAIAVDALRRHYPGREVVTLNVDALGEIGGGIHCATQQMPAG